MNLIDDVKQLDSDRPRSIKEKDSLGYKPFAKNLVGIISEQVPTTGFIMAINGDWGSGKSTILNYMKHYFATDYEKKDIKVIEFNPWWFSGKQNLLVQFFNTFRLALEPEFRQTKKWLKVLNEFSRWYSTMSLPGSGYAKVAKIATESKQPDIYKLKEKVYKRLAEKKRRFVFFIDDVDRLTDEEVRGLFTTIRAVADFPFITYVVAFDRKVVEEALSSAPDSPIGLKYLEKIIQFSVNLTVPRADLEVMLREGMDGLLNKTRSEEELARLNAVLMHIYKLLNTPRQVIRYLNSLHTTLDLVRDDVNIADFVGLEALRILAEETGIYERIKNSPRMFTGKITRESQKSVSSIFGPTLSQLKEYHFPWYQKCEAYSKTAIVDILKILFPKLRTDIWGEAATSAELPAEEDHNIWRKERRICHNDYFATYFRLQLLPGTLATQEFEEIMKHTGNESLFIAACNSLAEDPVARGRSKLTQLLARLADLIEDGLYRDSIDFILKIFFDAGDELCGRDIGNYNLIMKIQDILFTLEHHDVSVEIKKLHENIQNGKSLELSSYVVNQIRKRNEMKALVSDEGMASLQEVIIHKIISAIEDKENRDRLNLAFLLAQWNELDSAGVTGWIEKYKGDKETVSKMLMDFYERDGKEIVLEKIEEVLHPAVIVDTIRELAKETGIPDDQKAAVTLFLTKYDETHAS